MPFSLVKLTMSTDKTMFADIDKCHSLLKYDYDERQELENYQGYPPPPPEIYLLLHFKIDDILIYCQVGSCREICIFCVSAP